MLQILRDAAKTLSHPYKKLACLEASHWLLESLIEFDSLRFQASFAPLLAVVLSLFFPQT